MKVIKEIDKMKTYARIIKKDNKLIGFVPTMGCFHEGHLSLMKAARKQTDVVITSVFVNKVQFGPKEDYEAYPRDLEKDENLAKGSGTDVMFCPTTEDMYPSGFSSYVDVEGLTDDLCGKSRPGHFRGVTTVVAKLFEIVKPDIAYFGEKDAQQAFVIQKMVDDLNMDVTLKIMPTVREEDGLAMSSRNVFLSDAERKEAPMLYKALKLAEDMVNSGEKDSKQIIKKIKSFIQENTSSTIDYVSMVDASSLKSVSKITGKVLVALAVFFKETRLIDNIIVEI